MFDPREKKHNIYFYILLLLFIGAFFVFFDVRVLNIWFTSWLIHGDKFTAYLGARAYLSESFSNDYGLVHSLGSIEHIVYLDIIPFFGIVVKLFCKAIGSNCLNIQYFGIWYFICFTLQIYSSYLICSKIFNNKNEIIISCFVLAFLPFFLVRVSFHPSLSSIFFLYFQLYFLFFKRSYYKYFLAVFLSFMTHPYMIAYSGFIFLFYIAYLMDTRKIFNKILLIQIILFVLALTLYYFFLKQSGFFKLNIISNTAEGFGIFNTNLNFFINPYGMSPILKDLKYFHSMQLDGNSYFGLGFIIFILFLIINLFLKYMSTLKLIYKFKMSLVVLFLIFFYSIYGNISFNESLIYKMNFLDNIPFVKVFRSNGRFIIIFTFILLVFSFIYYKNYLSDNVSKKIFVVLFLVQYSDIIGANKFLNDTFKEKSFNDFLVKNLDFNKVITSNQNIKKIIVLNEKYDFELYANTLVVSQNHNLSTNISFNPRRNINKFVNDISDFKADIFRDNTSSQNLFIFYYYNVINQSNNDLIFHNQIKNLAFFDKIEFSDKTIYYYHE